MYGVTTSRNVFKCSTTWRGRRFYSVPVCIVGAGPAGYYTAASLLQSNKEVKIDILEALPTPFGLVRSGVAPDHQDVSILLKMFDFQLYIRQLTSNR
ncbi:MAG: NAD(P)-binding protein [Candidatus Bathyarchaeia archaeon]